MFEPGEIGYLPKDVPPEEIEIECKFDVPCTYWRSCTGSGCGVKDYGPSGKKGDQVRVLAVYDNGTFSVESLETKKVFTVRSDQIMWTKPVWGQSYS